MNDKVNIKGVLVSQTILDLLNGQKASKTLDDEFLSLARAFDRPDDLPFLIQDIYQLKSNKRAQDIRFALVRIQIFCDMNMHKDLDNFQRWAYVSQTIENILFGERMIEGIDLDGKRIKVEGTDLLARVFQHEIDHINGTLFIDHLSKLKQQLLKNRLRKIEKGQTK